MSIEKLQQQLSEAEDVYHQLMLGSKEVTLSVGNFGSVTYSQTNIKQLDAYISFLKGKIAKAEGKSARQIILTKF